MNTKTELIRATILELDQMHRDAIANQETTNDNKLEIYNQVAQNMSSQRNYENERKKLVVMLNELIPLSKGVQDFLSPAITAGQSNKTLYRMLRLFFDVAKIRITLPIEKYFIFVK
jgi:hypothetical protein